MERHIENLERLYKTTNNKKNRKDYFVVFSDYVKYLLKNETFLLPFEALAKERQVERVLEIENLKIKCLFEYKKLLEEIKLEIKGSDNKIKKDLIIVNKNKEINHILKNWSKLTNELNPILCMNLVDILSRINVLGKTKFVEKYCKMNEEKTGILETKRLLIFNELNKKIEDLEKEDQSSIYGAYERTITKYVYFNKSDKEFKTIKKKIQRKTANSQDLLILNNLAIASAEKEKLFEEKNKSKKDEEKIIFNQEEAKADLERVHNYVIINLSKNVEVASKDEFIFNQKNSELVFKNKKIKIKKNSRIYEILKNLFNMEDPYTELFYEDMEKKYTNTNNTEKKTYDNLLSFQKRLKKYQLKDLLVINPEYFLLNKKYKIIR